MPLVDYPSSSEDESKPTTKKVTSHKRKRSSERGESSRATSSLPPLPSKFHDLYASNVRTSTHDDPTLHAGRKRITPHVEGNWPTHVYIEWYPSPTEHTTLTSIISDLQGESSHLSTKYEIHTFLSSDLGAPLPLHISLSRPIGFLTDKKDDFTNALTNAIKKSGVRPFPLNLTTLNWVSNFEKTRYFLVLRIKPPANNELNKILQVTNNIVQDFDQPPLYASPTAPKLLRKSDARKKRSAKSEVMEGSDAVQNCSTAFHFSVAWTLTEPSEEMKDVTQGVMEKWKYEIEMINVKVAEVKNKVGNVVHGMTLVAREVEGGSLFGF